MRWRSRSVGGDLVLALLLLLTAVAVDLVWVRPAEEDVKRLSVQKRTVGRAAMLALRERSEWEALRDYLGSGEVGNWRERYVSEDPLQLLEGMRKEAGVARTDVRLEKRESQGPFLRTRYFISVDGDFQSQLQFLKALEEAAPLITVDTFVMEKAERGSRVAFRLNVSVITLPEGRAS